MDILGKNALSANVGQRLRMLREERNISIRELARRSSLSANALSMIERGLTSPSVSTLDRIARALGIPITAFFRQEPERRQVVFIKANEYMRIPFMRGLLESLGGEFFSGNMEAFLLTLESGGNSGPSRITHDGHEFVFCLRGTLEYEVAGERHLLETGDSLIFGAKMPHRWCNPGDVVANAVIVIACFEKTELPGGYHVSSLPQQE